MQHIRRLTFQQMGVLWGQAEDANPRTHMKKKKPTNITEKLKALRSHPDWL
jgi:hypothetical protein